MGTPTNPELNLANDNFAVELLSWYLWGQATPPSKSEIADEKWLNRDKIDLKIVASDFLQKAGEFVNLRDFPLFETFFSGKTKNGENLNWTNISTPVEFKDGKYYLTQAQFADLFYSNKNGEPIKDSEGKDIRYTAANPTLKDENGVSITLYNRNSTNPNFAKLAFAFGSITVGLSTDKIRYVLDENLNPIGVENIEYEFDLGDFDFETNSLLAGIANTFLEPIFDPNKIGKTVNFWCEDGTNVVSGGNVSANEYFRMTSLDNLVLDKDEMLRKLLFENFEFVGNMANGAYLYLAEFVNILNSGIVNYRDENDKFTNLQNTVSNETASNLQNSQILRHSERSEESQINLQNIRHSEPLARHSERSEESHKNSQNIRHSELSKESEESQKNLQNVNSQTSQTSQTSQNSQNTLKEQLTFTEKLLLKDFAYKLYGVKMPETKQRIGIDAATQHKISFLLDTICEHKRQIVQTCGEKTWQETFENFQKTNDLKVFENAVKSQISNENVNLKNTNLQNSAGNVNSENNITNPQENGNDFKM